jgi:hypothetical protein
MMAFSVIGILATAVLAAVGVAAIVEKVRL